MGDRPTVRHLPAKARSRDLVPAEVRAAFRRLIAGEAPWPLLLWGPPGTGKTCSGLCLLDWSRWIQPKGPLGEPVVGLRYWTCGDYMRLTFDAMFNRREGLSTEELRKLIGRAGLIVLDELSRVTEAKESRVEAVLDLMDWREGRPLVLIANATPDELGRIYGPGLASRLSQGVILPVGGPDRRPGG